MAEDISHVIHFEVTGKDGKALQRYYGDLFGWKLNTDFPGGYGMTDHAQTGIVVGVAGTPGRLGRPGHRLRPGRGHQRDAGQGRVARRQDDHAAVQPRRQRVSRPRGRPRGPRRRPVRVDHGPDRPPRNSLSCYGSPAGRPPRDSLSCYGSRGRTAASRGGSRWPPSRKRPRRSSASWSTRSTTSGCARTASRSRSGAPRRSSRSRPGRPTRTAIPGRSSTSGRRSDATWRRPTSSSTGPRPTASSSASVA